MKPQAKHELSDAQIEKISRIIAYAYMDWRKRKEAEQKKLERASKC